MFGGAFDPPHNAHIALALSAVAALQLDELHVIPTGQAWHKPRALSAPEHRLAMARLAFQNTPHVVVDDRELRRAGPTFTIDTLRALQSEHPQAQLYLVIGADQFAAFPQWHEWKSVVDIAIICIAARAQFDWASSQFDAYKELKARFLELPMPQMPVSATQIRQALGSGLPGGAKITDLLPEAVARYIATHQLYSHP